MIAEKTGYAEFYALGPATGGQIHIDLTKYLTPRQQIMMAQDPYLIRAMARHLAKELTVPPAASPQIRVQAFAALNGRPAQHIIDSGIDLATAESGWIVQLLPATLNLQTDN
jgi:vitamin K-dependent gamma-carboxylase